MFIVIKLYLSKKFQIKILIKKNINFVSLTPLMNNYNVSTSWNIYISTSGISPFIIFIPYKLIRCILYFDFFLFGPFLAYYVSFLCPFDLYHRRRIIDRTIPLEKFPYWDRSKHLGRKYTRYVTETKLLPFLSPHWARSPSL